MKHQKDSKEPLKADLDRFGVARSFKMTSKMTTKLPSRVKKLIFGKVHISPALPMRERFRDLKKSKKIVKKHKNHDENGFAKKKNLLRSTFAVFDLILKSAGGPGGGQK